MTFVRASRIAGVHGYTSRLLMPGDQFESTSVKQTIAQFTSRNEGEQLRSLPYNDLQTMNEKDFRSILQKTTALS